MAIRKHYPGRRLGFQHLENRYMMAGNVTATLANHSLSLTGDIGGNQIEIDQIGANQFAVNGQNGTTVNGKASQTFNVTGDINAVFKAGDDLLLFEGGKSNGGYMTLPGSLNVDLGDGKNGLEMAKTYLNGNLSVTGGTGADSVNLQFGGVGLGTFNGGNNDCSINLGAGKNDVYFYYMQIERDLLINTNSATIDLVSLQGSRVGRNTSIQTGNGNDNIQLNEFFGQGKLSIASGAGNDQVILGETILAIGGKTPDPNSQKSVHVNMLYVDLGAGDDQLDLGNVNASSATIDGGAGNDTLYRDAKTGFGSLTQVNWQHQYNYGVGVIPANNPSAHRPTI
jgi:hypothetical protein